ncbi:MAG: hypothetical protein NE328_18300 [Lentisphaeraceae bacterium]|nr:hypothetical protein [Lentisphaeraceae bacterium]
MLLAIKIYELENGGLPENLTILKGKYISKIPIDYNTGLPVKYLKAKREIVIKLAGGIENKIKF